MKKMPRSKLNKERSNSIKVINIDLDQKKRALEYKQEVMEMQKRVSSRMCLFEMEAVNMAKRKAQAGIASSCRY